MIRTMRVLTLACMLISVVPLGGCVTSVEAKKGIAADVPAKPEPGLIAPGQWVDLVPLVDPAKDALSGTWTVEGKRLVLSASAAARLMFPIAPDGSYEFEVRYARVSGDGSMVVMLPVGSHLVGLFVSALRGQSHDLGKVRGGGPYDKIAVYPGAIENNKPHTVSAKVLVRGDQASIETTLDGAPLIKWQGPSADLSPWPDWTLPDSSAIGLGGDLGKFIIDSVRLRMLSGTARPRRAADAKAAPSPAAAAVTPGQWVELLRSVDPARDAVNGQWEWQGDSLALTGGEGARALMLPVRVTGSYELQVRFARTAGYDGLVFPLSVGSAQASLTLSGRAGAAHGLECIDGKNCVDNETSVKPGILQNNRAYSLHIRVVLEKDLAQVQATLDGLPLISWRGPVSALSAIDMWKLPRQNTIGLSSWGSNVVYYSVRLKMLSDTDPSLRQPGELVCRTSWPATHRPARLAAAPAPLGF